LLWKIDGLGRGYSSVAIVGKRLYTMGDRETPNPGQYVLAFDLGTRRELWATRIGPTHTDGPRATPTVDGKLLYVLGTEGDLACLDVEKGEVRWQQNLAKNYGGQMMSGWKYSESPLVDGDQVVCTPGGPDATVVALRKTTGELLWKCAAANLGEKGKDGAGYSSMVAADIAGVRQYVQVIGRGAIGVRASDGRLLWSYNRIANEVANIPTPLVRGDHVFVTTGYRTGCALLSIKPAGGGCRAEEVYFNEAKQFENHHGGVVLVGDCVFGGDGQNRGAPACLSFASGEVLWKRPPLARGSAAVLYADGHLVFRYDRGEVFWLEANPAEYRIKGQFKPVTGEGPAWAYPVIHNKRLYLRHADVLACYDLAASK
jgi:outer membrane protein assembly factor BamB